MTLDLAKKCQNDIRKYISANLQNPQDEVDDGEIDIMETAIHVLNDIETVEELNAMYNESVHNAGKYLSTYKQNNDDFVHGQAFGFNEVANVIKKYI